MHKVLRKHCSSFSASHLFSVPLEGLKSQGAFEEMRQNYIRELTKAIHMREKGLAASSQRFYHLTKLMDAMHDVGSFIDLFNSINSCLKLAASLKSTKTNMHVFFVTDREEGQLVLPEHLHPGRCHESGVSRDDVRGHCLPASQGSGRHGEAPPFPHQVMMAVQTSQLCRDIL